ncbi:DinB family protein [Alkalicoccobacillus gibsonii]|uniref:DinB family protein n=1 Tax=Alkalicoccobacillus gibsonii TaxID=79881 RepID=UPI001932FF9C|nr:DinB family protein [Alkalicoccobacillus gibsonii]MBM0066818.1 DinB family protein [Alkalicoccobacillus gibsonii]
MKEEILEHQRHSIEFVESLRGLNNKLWRTPISEGKWTIAEIIGHFESWDTFILKNRLPYIIMEHELPKSPKSEKINANSAYMSRSEKQDVTINTFVLTRRELYKAIHNIPDEMWTKTFSIGNTTVSMYEYFTGLAKHDHHHFNQIKDFLSRYKL